jgi:excisionase family DNA binding protein
VLTPKQAAQRAGVSVGLIYGWCESKQLAHYRAGVKGRRGKILIAEADLEAFMQTLRVETAGLKAPPPKAKPFILKNLKMG